jgi:hypothetical protein
MAGKAAALRRHRAFDSSRAVLLTSTSVRRKSRGLHRVVFAIASSYEASLQIAVHRQSGYRLPESSPGTRPVRTACFLVEEV